MHCALQPLSPYGGLEVQDVVMNYVHNAYPSDSLPRRGMEL